MRRSAFRSRVAIGSLALSMVAVLIIPAGLASGAGAQEAPAEPPATVEKGPLSATLQQLVDAPPAATTNGDPALPGKASVDAQLAALDLPTDGAGTTMVREDGRILVDIVVADTSPATVDAIAASGAEVTLVSDEYRTVNALVGVGDIAALAEVTGVLAVSEVLTPLTSSSGSAAQAAEEPPVVTNAVNCTTNPTGIISEGDEQLSVKTARTASSVDGTGVKVGVLSDTYNRVGSPSVATDIANAELPGPGNPCGNTTAVQIVNAGPGSGSDEGRAMAQIVHDLAPKSPLAFASAFNGELDFANQIRALQTAGSKVIVDDVTYLAEPFYQDGPVAKAVNDVTAAGASYFSSAANSTPDIVPTGGSYEAMAYRNMLCPTGIPAGYDGCHDYNGGGGTDAGNLMTIPSGEVLQLTIGWSQPMYGVTTDLDVYILNAANGQVLGTPGTSDNIASGRPTDIAGFQNTSGAAINVNVVVARFSGGDTANPRFKAIVHRNPATSVEWRGGTVTGGDVAGPTTFGHNAALTAGTIAAIPFNNANTVEPFSSRGPAHYCWQPINGSSPQPAMACQTKNLDVAATDGVANSFFGGFFAGAFRFFGTSAAAPHAAAIAALQTQKQPCRTPAQIIAAQRSSAVAFGGFGIADYGSGRVTATTAITGLAVCNPPVAAGFHPLTPSRILDSRTNNGGWDNTKLVAGNPRSLQVTGRSPSNIPSNASAVVMNVTSTDSSAGSFLKIWPTGTVEPNVSNLNFNAGQTIPNLVTVRLGTGGKVDIATAVGATNVVADVVGYFDNGVGPGDRFTGIDPVRLLDSRESNGGWNGQPLPAGTTRDLVVRQPDRANGVPAGATAIIANVTVVGSTAHSFLRVWPSGETEPGVSNLNFLPGQIIPNLVMVKIGANGKVSFSNNTGSTHVVVDVVGYYNPSTGSKFYAVDPTRVLDSRVGNGLNGKWNPGQTRDLTIAGPGTIIPDAADGVIANFTVTDGNLQSLITVFPSGTGLPTASNLNFLAGEIIPNLVAVRIPANNKVSIYNDQGTVNVIADVVGYFAPAP